MKLMRWRRDIAFSPVHFPSFISSIFSGFSWILPVLCFVSCVMSASFRLHLSLPFNIITMAPSIFPPFSPCDNNLSSISLFILGNRLFFSVFIHGFAREEEVRGILYEGRIS